jgi:hypothetical protein
MQPGVDVSADRVCVHMYVCVNSAIVCVLVCM